MVIAMLAAVTSIYCTRGQPAALDLQIGGLTARLVQFTGVDSAASGVDSTLLI